MVTTGGASPRRARAGQNFQRVTRPAPLRPVPVLRGCRGFVIGNGQWANCCALQTTHDVRAPDICPPSVPHAVPSVHHFWESFLSWLCCASHLLSVCAEGTCLCMRRPPCALSAYCLSFAGGQLYAMGLNHYGQLGTSPARPNTPHPVESPRGDAVTHVMTGAEHSAFCAGVRGIPCFNCMSDEAERFES